jgi:hypothetical protein
LAKLKKPPILPIPKDLPLLPKSNAGEGFLKPSE